VAGYTAVCILVTTYSSGTFTASIITSNASARAGGGGGGGISPSSPGIPTYNGPNVYYAANYSSTPSTMGKGIRFFDGSWSTSGSTITVGVNANETDFCMTQAQVGWLFAGQNNAASSATSTTATSQFAAGTTILTVSSCTSFTVSNTATTGCASTVSTSLCQIVIAPQDDRPAVLAAYQAMLGSTSSCNGELVLPQGILWISAPITATVACNATVAANGAGNGTFIVGQGVSSTILFMAPGTWTTSGNKGAMFFNLGTGLGNSVHYANFTLDGAGQIAALTGMSGAVMVLGQNSSASYVNIFQFGATNGILCSGGDGAEAIIDHVIVGAANNGGGYNVQINGGCKSSFSAYNWSVGAANAQIQSASYTNSTNDTFDNPTTGDNILVNSGEVWITNPTTYGNGTNKHGISVTSGAIAHIEGGFIAFPKGGTNAIGIATDSTPSIVYAHNVHVAYSAIAGSKALSLAGTFYDLGGNVFATNIANVIGGTYSTAIFSSDPGNFGTTYGEYWSACETNFGITTLSTGATTTTTGLSCLPANSIIEAVVARVTTTITASCTGWELGDGTTAARFTTNNTNLTATTQSVPFNGSAFGSGIASATTGTYQASASAITITCAGGNPGAGAMRVIVVYRKVGPPTG
jgi:hypothetical protein